MTLAQLRYAVAVDTWRHFATAAEKCFVTQPTLSMQLHKLEQTLDVLLFDRTRQPVEPTPIGRKILDQARIILREADLIEQIIQQDKGVLSGELKVGIIPTVSTTLLPRFLSAYNRKFPAIDLVVEELPTAQIIEKLNRNQLDCGIMATPLHNDGLVEKPLFYEPFMAFVPDNHRLANEQFVLQSELDLSDMLLLQSGHCFRQNVINLCNHAQAGVPGKKGALTLQSGSFETLIRLARQGFGMTLIPYLTALDLKATDKKYIKPIAEPQPSREISLVWVESQVKTGLINTLFDIIQAAVPEKLLAADSFTTVSPLQR